MSVSLLEHFSALSDPRQSWKTIKPFAEAVRAHWGIENSLHWVPDVVYHDDLMRLRTEHGPANMTAVRHMALNLTRNINDKTSLKCKRKKLGWNDDYLFQAITTAS